ncbi:MAG TPA: sulfatase-like hydrolase/transferase, partial [Kofleriaceae bacterium]|nr:sulfatase-like hydrolase/transferase [Kofleriaceae bacterium]
MSSEPTMQPASAPGESERPYVDSLAAALSAALIAALVVAAIDIYIALGRDSGSGETLSFALATLALYAPFALAIGLGGGLFGGAWRATFGDGSLRRWHARLRADRRLDVELCAWLLAAAIAAALFAALAALLALQLVGRAHGPLLLGAALAVAAPVLGAATIPMQRGTRKIAHVVPRVGLLTGTLLLVLFAGLGAFVLVLYVVFERLDWRALDLGIWMLLAGWLLLWLAWIVLWRGPLAALRRRIPARGVLTAAAVALSAALPAILLGGAPSPRVSLLLSNQSTGARVMLRVARAATDGDGDGYSAFFGGPDCDDGDAAVNPGAKEIPDNGKDDNCLGGDRLSSAAGGPTPPPPAAVPTGFHFDGNLVFVLVDTVRADRLGVAGYRRNDKSLTPRMDQLAAESVRFTNVHTQSPNTPRALPTIFSSRYPSQVHYEDPMNNFSDLQPENLLIWEILQRAKLHTVGVASHFYFVRAPHILEGFDEFDNLGATGAIAPSNHDIAAPRIVPKVEEKLAELGKQGGRFAMFVHLFEPHSTYMEHPENPDWKITEHGIPSLVQKYDYEIAFVDGYVGRVLDAIDKNGLRDKTMVVLIADHGEAFGQHRFAGQSMFFHGQTLYEELLRVPLLVRLPGIKPAVIETPVALVDVAP